VFKSLYLSGLGGQGIVTLAKIVGNAAAQRNYQVKVFNAKGMAQRGGRVSSEIRISSDPVFTYGSRIAEGGADILICLETGEALNSLSYLKVGGAALLLDYAFVSAQTILKNEPYPTLSQVQAAFSGRTVFVRTISEPRSPYNIFTLGFFGSVLDEHPELLPGRLGDYPDVTHNHPVLE
jgi:indolepyruvate ferredoxin oxidoreductase beta subunit